MTHSGGTVRRGRYHHGDLPAALIDAGRALLAEHGPAGFSVAAIARRVGVSTAAPYRHFADHDRLLAAVVTRSARDLAHALHAAADAAGPDPAHRLTACAGAYTEFVASSRVGLDMIFAPALRALHDEELADAGRAVMAALMTPARQLTDGPGTALRLVEQVVALAHGYATLDVDGFLATDRITDEPTCVRAARAAAALVAGHGSAAPPPAGRPTPG